uniref:Ferroptosis suppressor protein 1 n=1 Tax=Saccoglossus kowalevskii TaxID=10224 RepID=A0ABM0MN64_SACKO|nr:PREDICTED: apoptosis-inducing factor 2-like [Saccoglossus kowalevskii]
MGGNSSKLPDSYNIVIIGGGFAGCEFAMKLKEKSNKFTLIDGKEAMHINTGALRASVEASFAKKTLISYKEMFGDNFKHGVVRAIDTNAKTVTLVAGDEVVTYTHLVIATGSVGLFPAKLMMTTSTADALLLYRKQVEEIRGAKSIVIIGGGAVGVELAGEIATDYKDKQVTIIHPHHFLVSGTMSERFQKEVKEQLKILNVKLILGKFLHFIGSYFDE